ncbi:hypothetical protein TDB9533_02455 [Thalassocella blandensis]|nr:hypothetical protein TDB9533_02455 [Thalassocella blandensis]
MLEFKLNTEITVAQFKDVLHTSGLAERRPVDDDECLAGMLQHANLTVSAWHKGQLVAIARSVTDFHYACYLSDLAVHRDFQDQGVGKSLMDMTQAQLKNTCKLILLAAPDANDYYPKMGFEQNPRCWIKAGR